MRLRKKRQTVDSELGGAALLFKPFVESGDIGIGQLHVQLKVSSHIDSVMNFLNTVKIAKKCLYKLLKIERWEASVNDQAPVTALEPKQLGPVVKM